MNPLTFCLSVIAAVHLLLGPILDFFIAPSILCGLPAISNGLENIMNSHKTSQQILNSLDVYQNGISHSLILDETAMPLYSWPSEISRTIQAYKSNLEEFLDSVESDLDYLIPRFEVLSSLGIVCQKLDLVLSLLGLKTSSYYTQGDLTAISHHWTNATMRMQKLAHPAMEGSEALVKHADTQEEKRRSKCQQSNQGLWNSLTSLLLQPLPAQQTEIDSLCDSSQSTKDVDQLLRKVHYDCMNLYTKPLVFEHMYSQENRWGVIERKCKNEYWVATTEDLRTVQGQARAARWDIRISTCHSRLRDD